MNQKNPGQSELFDNNEKQEIRAENPLKSKISSILYNVFPKNTKFEFYLGKSVIEDGKILRIVSDVWLDTRPPIKNKRITDMVNKYLSKSEKAQIIRIAILTTKEFDFLKNLDFLFKED